MQLNIAIEKWKCTTIIVYVVNKNISLISIYVWKKNDYSGQYPALFQTGKAQVSAQRFCRVGHWKYYLLQYEQY